MFRILTLMALFALIPACDSGKGTGTTPNPEPAGDAPSGEDATTPTDSGDETTTPADTEDPGPTDIEDPSDADPVATDTDGPDPDTTVDPDTVIPPPDTATPPDTTPDGCPGSCTLGDKACDGPLLQECVVGPDGCPTMGTVQDCAALGLTCVASGECGQDTGPPPTGDGLLCSDIDQCIVDECGPNLTSECLTDAFNNICLPQADSFAEVTLYLALNTCLGTNCAESPSVEAQMACITDNCLSPYVACFSGGFYGDGSCGQIDLCVGDSGCAATGTVDFGCARTCYQAASEDANGDYWTFQLCVAGQCAQAADVQTCAAEAGIGDVCGPLLETCVDGETTDEIDPMQ